MILMMKRWKERVRVGTARSFFSSRDAPARENLGCPDWGGPKRLGCQDSRSRAPRLWCWAHVLPSVHVVLEVVFQANHAELLHAVVRHELVQRAGEHGGDVVHAVGKHDAVALLRAFVVVVQRAKVWGGGGIRGGGQRIWERDITELGGGRGTVVRARGMSPHARHLGAATRASGNRELSIANTHLRSGARAVTRRLRGTAAWWTRWRDPCPPWW
jgi:hypothetical protein